MEMTVRVVRYADAQIAGSGTVADLVADLNQLPVDAALSLNVFHGLDGLEWSGTALFPAPENPEA